MSFQVATQTDVGRVRQNNEDSFFCDEQLGLFIVADGMGGHNAGEVASRIACETIKREIVAHAKVIDKFKASGKNSDAKAVRKLVDKAVNLASKEIYKHAAKNPEQMGMGTTLTMMLLAGHGKGVLGHCGDSRLYVFRGGVIHQLSEDHTFVNELLKRGAITKAQAKNHPQGNVLSRALGPQPSIAVDTMIFDVDPGDTYLLCSDGLYNYYPDSAELGSGLGEADIAQGLNSIIQAALERGGHDNTTGIVVRFEGGDAKTMATAAESRISLLKRIPIFAHLGYNELVKVVGLTTLRKSAAGEDIVSEGHLGDELFVVLAGEAEVVQGTEILAVLQAGVHFGEMAMIDNAPRSATVRAKVDCNLLVMRRAEFFSLIRSEPVIATKMLWSFVNVLSGRLRETNEALRSTREEVSVGTEEFEVFMDEGDEE